jgi:hypothetical protein
LKLDLKPAPGILRPAEPQIGVGRRDRQPEPLGAFSNPQRIKQRRSRRRRVPGRGLRVCERRLHPRAALTIPGSGRALHRLGRRPSRQDRRRLHQLAGFPQSRPA